MKSVYIVEIFPGQYGIVLEQFSTVPSQAKNCSGYQLSHRPMLTENNKVNAEMPHV